MTAATSANTRRFHREKAEWFLTRLFGAKPAGRMGFTAVIHGQNGMRHFETGNIQEGLDWCDKMAAHPDISGIYVRQTLLVAADQMTRDARGKVGRGLEADTAAAFRLWGDLDYGTDGHKPPPGGLPHPPTGRDAFTVLDGLPRPSLIVHSGGGFYPFWDFDQPVDVTDPDARARISKLSAGWQEVIADRAAGKGWHYGTGNGDLARVLRLPGTYNRKDPANPRLCDVVPYSDTGEVFTIEQLEAIVAAHNPQGMGTPAAPAPRPAEANVGPAGGTPGPSTGPLDTLDLATWADILEPAGWTLTRAAGAMEEWRRPGGTFPVSARVLAEQPNVLVVHSTDAGLPAGAGQRLTKGRVYAHLWHDGDTSAAGRELLNGTSPGTRTLPPGVLAALDQHKAAQRAHEGLTLEGAPVTRGDRSQAVETAREGQPDDDTDKGPAAGRSWAAQSIAGIVQGLENGTLELPQPTVGRLDGANPDTPGALFYRGRLNTVAGESTAGKTWVALITCAQELAKGNHVIYVDLEDTPAGVIGRLLHNLDVPADQIMAGFHYVAPAEKLDTNGRAYFAELLNQTRPTLVVIDSTGEGLALDGANPNDDDAVALWFQTLPRWISRHDSEPAVVTLDHITKKAAIDGGKAGMFAIGSQRKKAALSGAQYMLETRTEFAKNKAGWSQLVCAKDRGGNYPGGEKVGRLGFDPADGFTLTADTDRPAHDGTFRPTVLMGRVSDWLDSYGPASQTQIEEGVTGKRAAVRVALAQLIADGNVSITDGPRNSKQHHLIRPFAEPEPGLIIAHGPAE